MRWCVVAEAVVDREGPSLPKALEACAGGGFGRVVVVPASFSVDRALLRWLEKVARRWARGREGTVPEVVFARSIAEHRVVMEALREVVAGVEGGEGTPARPSGSLEDPAGWSVIPPHERHVLTCTGPRCTARGAWRLWERLGRRLNEVRPEGRGEDVLVARTGCLYPCNVGPMMVVYPEGSWHCVVDERAVDEIVEGHLVAGVTVREYARGSGKHVRPERVLGRIPRGEAG